jgi:hypothetical protein
VAVTVSVYEKNGLCRGPAIGNATFRAVSTILVIYDIPLAATAGGPLSGSTNVYTVAAPRGLTEWNLRVAAPGHAPWVFFVRDMETHEVWLSRQ